MLYKFKIIRGCYLLDVIPAKAGIQDFHSSGFPLEFIPHSDAGRE